VIRDVDLHRLQEAFFRDARDAPIGQQIELLALRLDRRQPHLQTAFDAGHLDGDLKARAGRRRSRYLQHRIPRIPKEETQRYPLGSLTHYVRFPTQLEWAAAGYGLRNGSTEGFSAALQKAEVST
jgi:hypothetical protein